MATGSIPAMMKIPLVCLPSPISQSGMSRVSFILSLINGVLNRQSHFRTSRYGCRVEDDPRIRRNRDIVQGCAGEIGSGRDACHGSRSIKQRGPASVSSVPCRVVVGINRTARSNDDALHLLHSDSNKGETHADVVCACWVFHGDAELIDCG